MKNQKVVIRFDEVCARDKYDLRRIEGTATVGSMIRLIDVADLQANPREAKVGDVTDAIEESLNDTPKLFPFKTKGILLAAGKCDSRDRKRFQLHFDDEDIEGVLDGGHNLLPIALHILRKALGEDSERALRGLKRWEMIPDLWKSNRDAIEAVKSKLDFLTPLEVIFPQEARRGEMTLKTPSSTWLAPGTITRSWPKKRRRTKPGSTMLFGNPLTPNWWSRSSGRPTMAAGSRFANSLR